MKYRGLWEHLGRSSNLHFEIRGKFQGTGRTRRIFQAEGTVFPKAGDLKDLASFEKLTVPQGGSSTQLEVRNGQI